MRKGKEMARRYFNWKLAIVLVMGFAVLGATATGLRHWQRDRRADYGLEAGLKAYDLHKWEEAAVNLGRYLAANQDDVQILLKYADAQLKIVPPARNRFQQAIAAYRAVLRADKANAEAAARLTETYIAIREAGEAELIARRQIEINADPELRRLLAWALAGQRKFDEAATELQHVIEEHPDQVSAYETLGQLAEQRPVDFPDPPEHWFNLAVKNNPSTALAYIIRAAFYLRNKDTSKALADLQRAEKQDLSPEVRLRLASELVDANMLDQAERHLDEAQKALGTDERLWIIWARLARSSQSQAKMLQVAKAGLEALSSYPWRFLPMAAELSIYGGQLEYATDCISKMREKDIYPEVVANLEGFISSEKGDHREAVKCYRRSMELGNDSPQIRLALALALSRVGETESALGLLRALVLERPDFFEARMMLVRLLNQTRNWAEARKHVQAAMQLSPDDHEVQLYDLQTRIRLLPAPRETAEDNQERQKIKERLAELQRDTDRPFDVRLLQFEHAVRWRKFEEADALLEQLKTDGQSKPRIAMAEAELLIAQDDPNKAISILRETINENPEAVEPVRYLASLLVQKGQYKEAEETLDVASERIEQPIAKRDLGLLLADSYTRSGKSDKAYERLKTLAEGLPADIPVRRRLLACEQLGKNPEKAQQIIDEIKSIEGEDGWQWRYEQARLWAREDTFKNRYPRIVALLQKNLLTNANDQASRMLLGSTYERAGELQLAISTYRDAYNRSPNDIGIIIPIVAALYKAQQNDEADQILTRASDQKLDHPQLETLQLQSYLRRGEISSASDILQNLFSTDPNNQAAGFSLAILKMQQNKFDEAGELLASLKALDPNSLAIAAVEIQLNINQNKPDEALRLCNEAVTKFGSASAYTIRARTYAALGRPDRAIEDFGRALEVEPKNAEAWVARSDFYLASGREVEAAADITQALSLAPDNIQIQKRAIRLFTGSGNPDTVRKGKALLAKAAESSPEDTELQMLKARSLRAEGTRPAIENAEKILQRITEDRPATIEAWVLLGEILLSQQQSAKAIDAALQGLAHKPEDKALLLLKARAEAARSPILAIPTLGQLRKLDPNDADIALYLANTYAEVGEPEKAVNLLKEQLTLNTGTSHQQKLRIGLAVALYQNGNKADAQKEFNALLQSAPDDPAPLLAEARLLTNDKLWSQLKQKVVDWYDKHQEDTSTPIAVAAKLAVTQDSEARKVAEDLLHRILERDAKHLVAMNTLAMLLQLTGRNAESAKLYQQILKLKPDSLIAINNLAWIMCEEQGKCQEALELTERGLKVAPQYIDLIDTRGVVYYRLGEYNKAIEDFTTCIKLYQSVAPPGVASHFHLARAFAKLGQTNKAIEHLNQALDLDGRIGGLSTADLAEARQLLEQLQGGS